MGDRNLVGGAGMILVVLGMTLGTPGVRADSVTVYCGSLNQSSGSGYIHLPTPVVGFATPLPGPITSLDVIMDISFSARAQGVLLDFSPGRQGGSVTATAQYGVQSQFGFFDAADFANITTGKVLAAPVTLSGTLDPNAFFSFLPGEYSFSGQGTSVTHFEASSFHYPVTSIQAPAPFPFLYAAPGESSVISSTDNPNIFVGFSTIPGSLQFQIDYSIRYNFTNLNPAPVPPTVWTGAAGLGIVGIGTIRRRVLRRATRV